jgi:hypothetical protein
MKMRIVNRQTALSASFILVTPAAYFLAAIYLNGGFNCAGSWFPLNYIFEKPVNKWLMLPVNLLILVGPLLALGFNLLALTSTSVPSHEGKYFFHLTFYKPWIYIGFALFSLLILGLLSEFLITGNCLPGEKQSIVHLRSNHPGRFRSNEQQVKKVKQPTGVNNNGNDETYQVFRLCMGGNCLLH